MPKIWLTSDWHFNHDKEFIYKPRGFNSVEEMNEAIVARHNEVVAPEDTVWVLGDLMMGPDVDAGLYYIDRLKGHIRMVAGNHDTNRRLDAYYTLRIEENDAKRIDYQGYHFFLCHYPTMTANFDKSLKACMINLFGHTHQQTNFYNEMPWMYHVGVDSHNCYPVSLDDALREIKDKANECKSFL